MSKTRQATARLAHPAEASEFDLGDASDVTDRICATLAAAISEGALRPGTKILEDAIADHFGVSRTVVRGALGILQRDHLLERKRNRGTFVAEPSIEEARALFEARRALERVIIELVMTWAQPEDLDALELLTEEELRIHRGVDERAKSLLSGQFHIKLAQLSRNEVLTEMLTKLVSRISLVMALYEDEHHDDCGADYHKAILAALRRGDLKATQDIMDAHLADIEGRVRLTQGQGERHSFLTVLQTFSNGAPSP